MPLDPDRRDASGELSVVVVGGGPRGSGLLERLVANAPELLRRPLTVHVVEPFAPGAGRIWRPDQSPLLWANSRAEDMTMFTDASCRIAGPILPGPTFQEWARVEGMSFPARCLVTDYLTWVFRRTLASAPDDLTVRVHRDRAIDLTQGPDGRQHVRLEHGARPLAADAVVLAQGHLPTVPIGPSARVAAEADRYGLTYLAEEYTADSDLSVLPAGADVIVRGAGLAFVDLAVLVGEGRGGRFTERADGRLVYHPCGREPRLFVGSRRGVPYHSKITYRLQGPPAPHPRFLDRACVDGLLARDGALDFRRDVWPLLAKELAFGHYHELFAAHPEATVGGWSAFEATLAAAAWDSPDLAAAVTAAVPDPRDRFDPDAADRPLRGVRLPSTRALQDRITRYLRDDIARRADPRRSADLGVFTALVAVIEPLGRLMLSGRIAPESAATDVAGFLGFFNFFASGPPPRRLRELLALTDAGIVQWLGADVDVAVTPSGFVATGPTVPGQVTARALVEARVPGPSVSGTADPLLAALFRRGEVAESGGRVVVDPATCRIVDGRGRAHPARYAFGSGTSGATPGAFSRPGSDAAFFRQNDAAVRTLLARLADCPRTPAPGAGTPGVPVEELIRMPLPLPPAHAGADPGTTVLDNPAWASLTGHHASLADRHGRAARFGPDVTPFVALADPGDPRAWSDLRTLLGPGATAVVTGPVLDVPGDWTVVESGQGVQLIDTALVAAPDPQAERLGPRDVPQMLALVERTRPGPFLSRTVELGTYLGIRHDGRLVAMAGERLHPRGWTEISAVCTDEEHRGRGLATRLVRAVAHGIRARGERPFLHTGATNTPAIRLYETLGFTLRRRTTFALVATPAGASDRR